MLILSQRWGEAKGQNSFITQPTEAPEWYHGSLLEVREKGISKTEGGSNLF